jgi:hypothetical protein
MIFDDADLNGAYGPLPTLTGSTAVARVCHRPCRHSRDTNRSAFCFKNANSSAAEMLLHEVGAKNATRHHGTV